MKILPRVFHHFRRLLKAIRLFLMIAGPGIIVMVADNDAGGITTYAATGAMYGYNLIWVILLLAPVCNRNNWRLLINLFYPESVVLSLGIPKA